MHDDEFDTTGQPPDPQTDRDFPSTIEKESLIELRTPPVGSAPEAVNASAAWGNPVAWQVQTPAPRTATVVPLRTANDTPFPPVLMDWPLPPREEADPVRAITDLELCPDCRTALSNLSGTRYCLKCGYSSDKPRESVRKVPSTLAIIAAFTVLLAGAAAIVAASIYRREFLDAGTTARTWWIPLEAFFGFVLYWVGHYLAVYLTIRHWSDDDLGQHLDPLCVWRYGLAYLPKTQPALAAGFWGVTALVTAFVLFCLNDYSMEDKTTRPPKYGSVVGKADRGSSPDYNYTEPAASASSTSRRRGPTKPIDTSEPPPANAPKLRLLDRTTDCVVIGYIPDSENPNRVAQLVLGDRASDGTITYAGTAGQFAEESDRTASPSRFRRLAKKPDYLPVGGNIIPVEPTLTARVSYAEKDGQGRLQNATINSLIIPKE